jgi:hypothetical protein
MMSETSVQSKSATRGNTSDQQIFAYIDKWLSVIREIVSERSAPSKFPR